MANVKIKNLDKVFAAIKEAIADLPESMYSDIEKMTIERIVQKARTGKTMASGTDEKLKPLSPDYIKQRKNLDTNRLSKAEDRRYDRYIQAVEEGKSKKFNETKNSKRLSKLKARGFKVDSEFFSPARSNLTLTGQYLRSFKRAKLDRRKGLLVIEPSGTRKEGLTNKKLAEYLGEQGRSIFGLDKTGTKRIYQRVIDELRRRLKRK